MAMKRLGQRGVLAALERVMLGGVVLGGVSLGCLLLGCLLLGCGGSKPASDPSAAEASAESSGAGADAAASSLQLVQAAAQTEAARWSADRARAKEQELSLKLVVEGKSAIIVGQGDGSHVLTGVDAVNATPDIVVELSKEDANAIANGESTLKKLNAAGRVQTNNEQGLELFFEFLDE